MTTFTAVERPNIEGRAEMDGYTFHLFPMRQLNAYRLEGSRPDNEGRNHAFHRNIPVDFDNDPYNEALSKIESNNEVEFIIHRLRLRLDIANGNVNVVDGVLRDSNGDSRGTTAEFVRDDNSGIANESC